MGRVNHKIGVAIIELQNCRTALLPIVCEQRVCRLLFGFYALGLQRIAFKAFNEQLLTLMALERITLTPHWPRIRYRIPGEAEGNPSVY